MVRISSTLLPTNANGVPQHEIVNTILDVSDSTAQGSLSSIDTMLSSTLDVSDSTAQGTLSSIEMALASVAVTGTFFQATQPVSIAGSVSVSQSATISGSRSNLDNGSAVLSGDASTAVDISSYSKNSVYVDATGSDQIDVLISPDGTNYYYYNSIYPQQKASGGNYFGVLKLDDDVIHSIKLEYTNSATVTAGVISRE